LTRSKEKKMTFESVTVAMNAARVCDAIARIGYAPASAIMDIIDNSVAAKARNITLEIEIDPDRSFGDRSNVFSYRIIDDGCGMENNQILNALKLGSDANYSAKSLSKYGMGLKSAGFSLGTRIEVISKRGGELSKLHYVDRVEMKDEYRVCNGILSEVEKLQFAARVPGESGSVITLKGCDSIAQQSAASTLRRLQDELGVVYNEFLSGTKAPLKITLKCTGKADVTVAPLDILFREDALPHFDPDTYDCKRPCLVLDEKLALLPDEDKNPRIQVVVFPKDKLRNYAGFSDEERTRIKKYGVSRRNKGFFIYRNNRMIRWGDDLCGLIGRDDLLFRGRLSITTDHDDELHVDVSKQRLMIPDYVLSKIEVLIRNALRTAKQVSAMCDALPRIPEGEQFNKKNEVLPVEDPDEPLTEPEKEESRKRKRKLQERTDLVTNEEEPDQDIVDATPVSEIPPFRKVRYSEKVPSVDLWSSGEDPIDGVFVRINRNHSFHPTVLSQLSEDSPLRQALEALIWSLAAAENRTLTNLTDVDPQTIEKVIRKFKAIASMTLDSWCARNQDLFSDD